MPDVRMTDATAPTTVARAFAQALASGDRAALRALLAPDVQLRALTPSRTWELDSAEAAIGTMLDVWFGGDRHVEDVASLVTDDLGAVVHVAYRFRASTPEGPAVVEQQAYLDTTGGTIRAVRLVCSGYQPVTTAD